METPFRWGATVRASNSSNEPTSFGNPGIRVVIQGCGYAGGTAAVSRVEAGKDSVYAGPLLLLSDRPSCGA